MDDAVLISFGHTVDPLHQPRLDDGAVPSLRYPDEATPIPPPTAA